MSRPFIVDSLLDLDFYKLLMAQAAYHNEPNTPVKYGFKNRTVRVKLGEHIKYRDLKRELDHVMMLRFAEGELNHLRQYKKSDQTNVYQEDFLGFLRDLRLPSYSLSYKRGDIILEFEGLWCETILWETIALSILNELYYRATVKDMKQALVEGRYRLAEKIKTLLANPGILFIEFGTRRRFSRLWQEEVYQTLLDKLPAGQVIGTSNVYLAMKHGQLARGTMAHEWFMAFSGIYHGSEKEIRWSHKYALEVWEKEYGPDFLVALSDTYGSDVFFEDFDPEMARRWAGVRQDSGDPIEFGERLIAFYESLGIDPRQKQLVPSDGLDLELMLKIYERFNGRIKLVFGWGTNLTNDLGYDALSLVIKIIEACGHGTVKFSDNLAKAMGSPEDIQLFKRIFVYRKSLYQETVY